ncbi:glycosyltransferase family 4 protein [Natribaculum luteum]|uniref:Glycosyltransferase family 4 protein n=1 Tax=Natribaculum luteum TaxID=1586232 RepID=A0ABD5NXI8_9EURY|nr:glycosyltransferase family 4 protein [Natribaculum luteum]
MQIGYICGTIQPQAYSQFLLEQFPEDHTVTVHQFEDRGWTPKKENLRRGAVCSWWSYPFTIATSAWKSEYDLVHIQFEPNNFGSIFGVVLVPFLIGILRLLDVSVVTTLHGPLFGKEEREASVAMLAPRPLFKPMIMPLLLFLYHGIVRLSDRTIVHGEVFRDRLEETFSVPTNSVEVVYHGVPS